MSETHVISALKSRRAELSGILQQLERQITQHREGLAHIDATILLFGPEAKPGAIKPKAQRRRNVWFGQNECIRAIYDVLRTASEPMTTRAITERAMNAKGIAEEDKTPELTAQTVLGSLNRAKDVERMTVAGSVVWRLA